MFDTGLLQKSIYGALVAGNVAGGRVYDAPPDEPTFPYVTIGDEQVIDDSNSCGASWEVFPDIHIWSRPASGSKVELMTLQALFEPLLATTLTIAGYLVVGASLETARSFRDQDGLTEHGVMTFHYLIDPA